MTMYGIPLDPHEIDALPQAERIVATIEQERGEIEGAAFMEAEDLREELERAAVMAEDVYDALEDLYQAVTSSTEGDPEYGIKRAKRFLDDYHHLAR